jgi:hypothetical protein
MYDFEMLDLYKDSIASHPGMYSDMKYQAYAIEFKDFLDHGTLSSGTTKNHLYRRIQIVLEKHDVQVLKKEMLNPDALLLLKEHSKGNNHIVFFISAPIKGFPEILPWWTRRKVLETVVLNAKNPSDFENHLERQIDQEREITGFVANTTESANIALNSGYFSGRYFSGREKYLVEYCRNGKKLDGVYLLNNNSIVYYPTFKDFNDHYKSRNKPFKLPYPH